MFNIGDRVIYKNNSVIKGTVIDHNTERQVYMVRSYCASRTWWEINECDLKLETGMSINPYIIKTTISNPDNTAVLPDGLSVSKPDNSCNNGFHDFKQYVGITNSFKYCTKCDKKV